ncbi:hypothetical protein LTR94_038299, partial [Friedmanniomyces endolithicus]
MVDDIAELVGEQARIERVAHRAHAHDREPRFEMARIVPGHGGDPVAATDAQGGERGGQAPCPRADRCIV